MLLRSSLILFVFGLLGCSTQEKLGQIADRCDFNEQCQPPLGCACVVKGQLDPEGNEEILQHGNCEPKTFDSAKCPKPDAAADALPPFDTGADADAGSDAEAGGEVDAAADADADAGAEGG